MNGTLTPGDLILTYVKIGFTTITNKGSDALPHFGLFFGSLLTLALIIHGTLLIVNDGKPKEAAKTAVWALIAWSFVDSKFYESFLVNPLITTRDNLAIFLMPSDDGTIFQSVQGSFAKLSGFGFSLIDSGGVTNITPIVIGLAVLLICGLYYLAILANLLFCEISLYLLFFFGLFIIPLGAFESARPMFKSWCGAIAKYVGVFIMIGALVGIIDAAMRPLLQDVISASYSSEGYKQGSSSIYLASVLALGSFGSYLLFKAMELTTEITGGVMSDGATGSQSIVNSAKTTLNTINRGATGVGSALSALKGMRNK